MDSDVSAVPPDTAQRPNGARIYDYMLGGKDNYVADRRVAEGMLKSNPDAWRTARANRAFLGRAVRAAATEGGVRQFLDIGTGLPTQQNVHQVAQVVDPACHVVYVDIDPVVVVHGTALLASSADVGVIEGDLRRPQEILDHAVTRQLIDFSRPVGVLLVAILHFVADADDPQRILATLREAMAPGSYLILSHTVDEIPASDREAVLGGFARTGTPLHPRSRERIASFFEGFDLLEPGVVDIQNWRPDDTGETVEGSNWKLFGGVGRLG